jgi:hypothetical protein
VSLRARAGDIEAYDTLEEAWIQVKGCHPSGVNGESSGRLPHLWARCLKLIETLYFLVFQHGEDQNYLQGYFKNTQEVAI